MPAREFITPSLFTVPMIFLYAPSTTVGTISVMVLVQSGQWGEAAAFTVVLITIAFTVLRLAQWLLGRQGIKLEL